MTDMDNLENAVHKMLAENTRLRAVNVELLAALEASNRELAHAYNTRDFQDLPRHPSRKVFNRARAAILKARGE